MNQYGGGNYNPYSTTSYGSNGPVGGGGFYNQSNGGGGGGAGFDDGGGAAGSGFGSPGSASKRSGGNTLRPVTIKQVLEAQQAHPDAEFRVDGVEVGQLTFVATIRSVAMQSTNVTYRMEDGTGMIDVKQWIDAEQGGSSSQLPSDTYVRVTGQLKSFHNKRHVGAHHIRPVTDHNEVIFHLLEATSIHLSNTRGPPGVAKASQSYGTNDLMDGIIAGNMSGLQQSHGQIDHLEPLQRQIMMYVHNNASSNEGVHVQTIAQSIQAPSASVMQAVEQLATDGLLYTTIDDDHVKSTIADQ